MEKVLSIKQQLINDLRKELDHNRNEAITYAKKLQVCASMHIYIYIYFIVYELNMLNLCIKVYVVIRIMCLMFCNSI